MQAVVILGIAAGETFVRHNTGVSRVGAAKNSYRLECRGKRGIEILPCALPSASSHTLDSSLTVSLRRARYFSRAGYFIANSIRDSKFGDRYFGCLHQCHHFAADDQTQILDRTGGDDGGDDTGRGLDIDFGNDRTFDDGFDFAAELITYVDGLNGHAILLENDGLTTMKFIRPTALDSHFSAARYHPAQHPVRVPDAAARVPGCFLRAGRILDCHALAGVPAQCADPG